MTKLELIEEIIEQYKLWSKNRSREYIYKRYYLYNELRVLGFSLDEIGKMFGGKHHATIIHGLRQHEDLHRFGYEDYKIATRQIDDVLHGATLPYSAFKSASVFLLHTHKPIELLLVSLAHML